MAEDIWELYDTRSDFSLANDLAAKNPSKLKELQAVFLAEAGKHQVPPLDDRALERIGGTQVGRPDQMGARTSLSLADGMSGMMEASFINVKNRTKTITAEIEVPKKGARGIILAQAARFGGWALAAAPARAARARCPWTARKWPKVGSRAPNPEPSPSTKQRTWALTSAVRWSSPSAPKPDRASPAASRK
jgi:hypothetical protein